MEMTCPKCRGAMNTYERNGITIDQCTECRGIFLDRGELERLIDAEAAFNASPAFGAPPTPRSAAPAYGSPQPPPEAYRREERYRDDDDSDRTPYPNRQGYGNSGHYDKKKRKRSFLEDLFD